ncbi:endolytic transglycosylase MltG [Candidatus Peribacteria bacterium]|nr:endolytic transglycosylase MltG [Candidatus Peribacteria bacterium]
MKQRIYSAYRAPARGKGEKAAPRRRWWVLSGVLVLGLLVGVMAWRWVLSAWYSPQSLDPTLVSLVIAPGSSASAVAAQLEDAGVIRSALLFSLYGRYYGLSSTVQAGSYSLGRDLTYEQLYAQLQHGQSDEVKITIPEGYTLAQIDALLAEKGLTAPGEILTCAADCGLPYDLPSLEGYLFPDTYYIPLADFSPRWFITLLKNTFDKRLSEAGYTADSPRTVQQVVTMASMVEREAAHDGEMPVIAGILWKRLDEGMQLGVDATTRYAKDDWTGPLYAADFDTDDPYNTRRQYGLPPTAIGNPGLAALRAAVHPEPSDYYYYLHDSSGRIHYGRTLDEHNANKRDYL